MSTLLDGPANINGLLFGFGTTTIEGYWLVGTVGYSCPGRCAPQTATPFAEFAAVVVGRKPPWNQPHVTPLAFNRSPIFLFPVQAVASLFISRVVVVVTEPPLSLPQSSTYGSKSPISVTTVPVPLAPPAPV